MKISVVMSVFNGATELPATLESIFSQSHRDFELIVVDDGSTDDTPSVLSSYRDPRMQVITQPNAGITRALIRGCEAASGDVIARHDCGDRSDASRLEKQLAVLERENDVVLVSCTTSYHAPEGERLYLSRGEGVAVRRSLLEDGPKSIQGLTHHGSAMFRRDAYLAVGGYREQFYFAQDLDLWVRLAAAGRITFLNEVLYEASSQPEAISWNNRREQLESTRLILAIRDDPTRATELLEQAGRIHPKARRHRRASRVADARSLYFIASCLRREGNGAWRKYARRAVLRNPFLLRGLFLLLRR
jgi:glycosyltransferase involved in cell wall biosynthesis